MSAIHRQVQLNINLTKEQLLGFYAGNIKQVVARDVRGQIIRFPVKILQPFVTHQGVSGRFSIFFNHSGKFVAIHKDA